MIDLKELLEIKARMLLAAEAAARMAVLDGEPLSLDEQTYELVMQALASLKDDTRAVLAEIDILRGMVAGDFDSLFGVQEHGRSADVAGVVQQEAGGGGAGEQPDATGTRGDVRSGGADGEDAGRPRAKRNPRRRRRDKGELDARAGEGEVDSSEAVRG